jgi:ribonuclease D
MRKGAGVSETAATELGIPELADAARAAGRLGIDTEFISEGHYRPQLCLVQVAVPDPGSEGETAVEVLDALDPLDPAPLVDVLGDPDIEIVMHAGWQDVAILRRTWGATITNAFDTQAAAGFAGFSAQAGYEGLLHDLLRIRLAKTASFTRWDIRPLTAEQLSYAREDVVHLLTLADTLQERLEASGRLEWAREEGRRVEDATDERLPEDAWRRLPRLHQLDPRSRAVARELAAWRERTAEAIDRPIGTLISDPTLLEVAKRRPADEAALSHIRGMHPRTLSRRGRELLEAVRRGEDAPPLELEGPRTRLDPRAAPLIALAEALVRSRAVAAGLAYELIASRADLTEIVRLGRHGEEADVRTLKGWRRDLVGAELLDLLAGRRSLSVDGGTLRVDGG